MGKSTLRKYRWMRLGLDACLIAGAWVSAYWIRDALSPWSKPLNPFDNYVYALPLIVLTWLASCLFFGLYNRLRAKTAIERTQDLLKSVLLGFLLTCTLGFLYREWNFARSVVFFSSLFNFVLLFSSWLFFFRLEQKLQKQNQDLRAIILGAGTTSIRVLQRIQDHPEVGYDVLGFLESPGQSQETTQMEGKPILGSWKDLHRHIQKHQVDEVFVADPTISDAQVFSLIQTCEQEGVTFWMVTNAFSVLSRGRRPLNLIGDVPLVQLSGQAPPFFYGWSKRCLDIVGSVLLLLMTAPFCLWWAIRIKLDSPGPILFSQKRVGHCGKVFTMHKFRTMHTKVAPYQVSPKSQTDPRITKYGSWLRSTSIDEVPQFLNVLKGEMSLVGPRPEMPFIVDEYQDWQRHRLVVKPGITGLWQILGRKDLPMHENIQYDFYYIRNRSFLLDLSILLRTVLVVLIRKGAW